MAQQYADSCFASIQALQLSNRFRGEPDVGTAIVLTGGRVWDPGRKREGKKYHDLLCPAS